MYHLNPYTPGAGLRPAYLAGREHTLGESREILAYLSKGKVKRSLIYYGLRGVGKTVLLNQIEQYADDFPEILYEHIEISENGSFKTAISLHCQKLIRQMSTLEGAKDFVKKAISILKGFTITYSASSIGETEIKMSLDPETPIAIGISDTGNFQNDLTELFVAMGTLAQKSERSVCFFIDEIQYMADDEFEALIAALHRVNQRGLPVLLFGAGLPKITKIAGDVKSYAERLFQFVDIGSLKVEDAEKALTEPAKEEDVSFAEDAVHEIIRITEGYPYFIQEYGNQVWNYIDQEDTITLDAVKHAKERFEQSLDRSFFQVRFDRATGKEKEFMFAMAQCGDLPCTIAEVAAKMNRSVKSISPIRSQLIHKGFIYATGHAEIDFTVPQFEYYLRRIMNQ